MYMEIKNIKKSYGDQLIFNDLNFDFSRKGIYLIKGESGCGKTTLLNIVAGYESFDCGERHISDHLKIAYIFQNYELIDSLTVKENLELVVALFGETFNEEDNEIMDSLGITALFQRFPKELSGGQKQRVGIARALLMHPDLILCDEPTEALDTRNKQIVLSILKRLSYTKTVLIVSHDQFIEDSFFDYIYMFKDHQLISIKEENREVLEHFNKNKPIHYDKMKTYLHKIIKTSSWMYTVVISFFIFLQLFLFQTHLYLFTPSRNTSAVNTYVNYVTRYSIGELEDIQNAGANTLDPCINFSPLQLNDQTYNIFVSPYPSISNCDEIIFGDTPKGNEILINQNIAKVYADYLNIKVEDLIQTELTLKYILNQEVYEIPFIISGIVQEDAIPKQMQLFYDKDYMKTYLQMQTVEQEDYENLYDYLLERGSLYALEYSYDTYKESYSNLKETSGISVYNSIMTPFEQQENERNLFAFVFIIVQTFIMFVTLILVLFYARKATLKHAGTLSIMISCGVNKDVLKKHYFKYKTKLFVGGVCLSYIAAGGIGFILFDEYVDFACLSFMGIYIICIVLLFSIVLHLILKKIKIHNINMILKEDKDI